jgi:hypothetical protein
MIPLAGKLPRSQKNDRVELARAVQERIVFDNPLHGKIVKEPDRG